MRTVIGYGSPRAGTNKVHGEAMGPEDTKKTKENLNWPADKSFYVPEDAAKHWLEAVEKGADEEAEWNDLFAKYEKANPELAAQFKRTVFDQKLADGWEKSLPVFEAGGEADCHAQRGQQVMNAFEKVVPEIFGGAADLTIFHQDDLQGQRELPCGPSGTQLVLRGARVRHVRDGERHGGARRRDSVWIDVLQLCRLCETGSAHCSDYEVAFDFVFTHDSIALGEDGPTHQPMEQLMMLRATPNLIDLRPADANETAAVWKVALETKAPSFLALSRQDLPVLDAAKLNVMASVAKGAYIVEKGGDAPKLLIVGDRRGGLAGAGGGEAAERRRHGDARDLDAELAALRAAERGVQGVDLPGSSAEAGGGSGCAAGLVEVGRTTRRRDWPGSLWRIGAGHDGAGEAGLQRGRRVCAGEEAVGELRKGNDGVLKEGHAGAGRNALTLPRHTRAASPAALAHLTTEARANASVMPSATPEIRAIYWDIGGVLLTNGWDHEERARVLAQFAIPRDEYESRHEEANDRWEKGELSDDEFLKQTVFFKERSFTPAEFLQAVRAQSKWLPGGAKNVIAALRRGTG